MNNRLMFSEHNQSPVQIWTAGMIQNINSAHIALTEAQLYLYGFVSEAQNLVNLSY